MASRRCKSRQLGLGLCSEGEARGRIPEFRERTRGLGNAAAVSC